MSEAQRRTFGGDGFIFMSPPNDKGEAAGTHLENEAALFTLASTRWLAAQFLLVDCPEQKATQYVHKKQIQKSNKDSAWNWHPLFHLYSTYQPPKSYYWGGKKQSIEAKR